MNGAGNGVAGSLSRMGLEAGARERPVLMSQLDDLEKTVAEISANVLRVSTAANRLRNPDPKAVGEDSGRNIPNGQPVGEATLEQRLSGVKIALSRILGELQDAGQRLDRAV